MTSQIKREALQRSFERALQWLELNTARFTLEGDQQSALDRLKPYVELIIAATYLTRAGAAGWSTTSPIVTFIREEARRYDWESALAYDPNTAMICCMILAFQRIMGIEEMLNRKLVAAAARRAEVALGDRRPYREIDFHYSLWQGGLAAEPRLDAAFGRTIASLEKSPLYYDRNDCYSVTHVGFYVTDWGLCDRPLVSPPAADMLREATQTLTGIMVFRNDPDVLGELLACWRFWNLPANAITDAGWLKLLAAQSENGSFSGLGKMERTILGTSPGEDDLFLANYHTTLVSAIAASAWIR